MKFRQFISIVFLTLYSITVFSSLLPYAEYALNYNYIATQLCENKAKPELKCHGKCHLNKQIGKAVEKTIPDEKEKSKTSLRILEFSPVILNQENTIYIGVNLFARELFLKDFILKSRTLDSDFKPPTSFLFIS